MALVLARRLGETVTVGPDVRITIVRISGDRVRLAIEAPKGVTIDRLEVHERRTKETAEWRQV